MRGIQLSVEVQADNLTCCAVELGDIYDIECGADAEHECVHCGGGVCIRCTDPCFTCAENLHTHCRIFHELEAKHPVDIPKPVHPFIAGIDALVDRVIAIVDGAQ